MTAPLPELRPVQWLDWDDLVELKVVTNKTQARRWWEKDPPLFPRPVHMGRILRWRADEIAAWQAAQRYAPGKAHNKGKKRPKHKVA
jgi:predicted DNA-binding transcriptional regulator AlpA